MSSTPFVTYILIIFLSVNALSFTTSKISTRTFRDNSLFSNKAVVKAILPLIKPLLCAQALVVELNLVSAFNIIFF